MKKAIYYIGADNAAGKVDTVTVEEVLNDTFTGYTLTAGAGYWEGAKEDSVLATVLTDESETVLESVASRLKERLHQYAVGLEVQEVQFKLV